MSKSYDINADFDYYVEHQPELVKKYNGRYIVIVNQQVVGDYATLEDAFNVAREKYSVGHFFLHQVGDGAENYSTTISRIGHYV